VRACRRGDDPPRRDEDGIGRSIRGRGAADAAAVGVMLRLVHHLPPAAIAGISARSSTGSCSRSAASDVTQSRTGVSLRATSHDEAGQPTAPPPAAIDQRGAPVLAAARGSQSCRRRVPDLSPARRRPSTAEVGCTTCGLAEHRLMSPVVSEPSHHEVIVWVRVRADAPYEYVGEAAPRRQAARDEPPAAVEARCHPDGPCQPMRDDLNATGAPHPALGAPPARHDIHGAAGVCGCCQLSNTTGYWT
jgi:hypothetical protein